MGCHVTVGDLRRAAQNGARFSTEMEVTRGTWDVT